MHIEFNAPTRTLHSTRMKLTPTPDMVERLATAMHATIITPTDPFTVAIATKHAKFELGHWNGGIRMTVEATSAELTQDEVDCMCKEVRYGIIGRKWVRVFQFGHNRTAAQISDEELVSLSRKTASWCHIRGGAMQIRASCPNCGIRNVHAMPMNTTHHTCGPKRVRERGTIKLLIYDCPGYTINPRAPRGLFTPPAESPSSWQST